MNYIFVCNSVYSIGAYLVSPANIYIIDIIALNTSPSIRLGREEPYIGMATGSLGQVQDLLQHCY